MATTLIHGGTVITSSATLAADVFIEGQTIADVRVRQSGEPAPSADVMIDAAGKYVFPGGVDVHTHMNLPAGGTFSADTFETGTRAAAWGGTTTIIDFATQERGRSVIEGFESRMAEAAGECAIDYGFHMVLSDVHDQSLTEMDILMEEGVTSFKLFMAYPGVLYSDDGQIFRAMQQAATNGSTIMMHAENGIVIDVLREQARQRGEKAPWYHALTRPPSTEAEATHRAIVYAELAGAPLYVVHMSAKEALAEIGEARARGSNVFAETCPQYLFLDMDLLRGPDGAKYVCSTPLRDRALGHQEALWQGLASDDLQVVSTDHCPFCMNNHPLLGAQKSLGSEDFTLIPNGLPGVEERMRLLYHGAVAEERMSLQRFVEVCATTPAKMFGIYPQKGTIAVGSDADIVIFDPAATSVLSAETHHMAVDYSAYEGREVQGDIDLVMSKGKVLVSNGQYGGAKGDGVYLQRGLNGCLT